MDQEALENSWFATRYQTLPANAAEQLRLASLTYADSAKAEMHLAMARMMASDNLAVKIGEYRYYFYKGRLSEAISIAEHCLKLTAQELGFPQSWRHVWPHHASFQSEEPAHRFYLFCLKAYAYLLLRLNDMEQGREAVEKLLQLDPTNKVGGQVLLDVLERIGKDDYDD